MKKLILILVAILLLAAVAAGAGNEAYGGSRNVAYGTNYGPLTVVAASDAMPRIRNSVKYKCSGSADEVEINAAMVEVNAAGGGVVALSAGNFAIAATIEIPSNVTLEGAGDGTILTLADGVTATMITNSNTTPESRDSTGNSNIIIRDMYIDGNKAGQGAGADALWCVGFSTVENLTIENLTVVDGWTAGIRTEFCTRVVIANNRVRYSGDDGIAINKQSYYVSCYGNDVREAGFDRTFAYDNGSGGTAWAAGHVLTGDTSNDPSDSTKSICTIESITITGGSFAGNDATGVITVTPGSQTGAFADNETLTSGTGGGTGDVDGATKKYGAAYGIEIQDAAHDVTCYGNRLWNTVWGGITVTSHDGEGSTATVSIANNTITRCYNAVRVTGEDASADIQKDVAIIGNVIVDTYFTGTAAGIVLWNTENVVVFGNNVRTAGGGLKTSLWTQNLSILANNFVNTTADGIIPGMLLASGLKHCTVRNNLIKDFQYKGIDVSGSVSAWGLQITDNSIVGCDRPGRGIEFGDPTDTAVVSFGNNGGSPDTVVVATNLTLRYYVGAMLDITDSTNNDGQYTVTAVSYGSPNTTISVATGSWTDEGLGTAYIEPYARECVLAGNYFEGSYWSRDVEAASYDQLPAQGGWTATWPNIDDTP